MLSIKDSRTILSRCGILFAAVVLSCALMSAVWDVCGSLLYAARLDAAERTQDILSDMADTGNRAALTGNISILDGIYDKGGFTGMAAYSSELARINTLRKWSGGQRAAITGARTEVTVRSARRTVRGFTATADYSTVYYISSEDTASPAALEVSSLREVELIRTVSGYIIASDEYSSAPIGRIYRE